MNVNQALNILLKETKPLASEKISLKNSNNRTLSKHLSSSRNIPPFDTSAMDGFAIRKKDLKKTNPLKLIGKSPAGDNKKFSLRKNECVKVYTGSKLPINCDYVLIKENATEIDSMVYIENKSQETSYVRKKGLDFKKGFLIKAPLTLNFKNIPMLASINAHNVSVYKKPKISIIPTGNEILSLGDKSNKNKIYSSSALGIKSLLEKEGATAQILPICKDNIDEISYALSLSKKSDIIITLGGVSKGDYDLIRKNYEKLGIKIIADQISMRPGKPLIIGKLKKRTIFCLPGNPISSIICSRVFVIPFLKKSFGFFSKPLAFKKAILANNIGKTGPREHYMRALSYQKGSSNYVKVFLEQDSSMHSILKQSNALVVQHSNSPEKKAGQLVDIMDL